MWVKLILFQQQELVWPRECRLLLRTDSRGCSKSLFQLSWHSCPVMPLLSQLQSEESVTDQFVVLLCMSFNSAMSDCQITPNISVTAVCKVLAKNQNARWKLIITIASLAWWRSAAWKPTAEHYGPSPVQRCSDHTEQEEHWWLEMQRLGHCFSSVSSGKSSRSVERSKKAPI